MTAARSRAHLAYTRAIDIEYVAARARDRCGTPRVEIWHAKGRRSTLLTA